jgi:Raf kinase inhibitor-like YbhB/YbcL family protein
MNNAEENFKVQSVAFSQNGHIPVIYSCEGDDINPPLEFSHFPQGTVTLALIMEDPDAPGGTFTHWIEWNISPNEAIGEGSNPGISGTNGAGKTGYKGPCPPNGTHRYFFRIYALDKSLELSPGASKEELVEAMDGHILASAELMGKYQKKKVHSS